MPRSSKSSKPSKLEATWNAIREYALSLPGAHEDHPWGESVAKVNKKVFVFFGRPQEDGRYGLSVKLPETGGVALGLAFVTPTGYGLGKSGWVSAELPADEEMPIEVLKEWILESYRAVAPKKLAAALDGAGLVSRAPAPPPKAPSRGARAGSTRKASRPAPARGRAGAR